MAKLGSPAITAAEAIGAHKGTVHLWPTIGRYLRRLWAGYWERRARRATMAVLSALDDSTLKDLGLHRSEVGSLVYGSRRDRRI